MTQDIIRIDIVSDIVCPWCAIGYHRMKKALAESSLAAEIHWHPFQLNPHIPQGGKNLRQHLVDKYGDPEASNATARQRMAELAADAGIQFNYFDEMCTYNTARLHCLLSWAGSLARQTELAEELFRRYFSEKQALDDEQVLLDAAVTVGLNRAHALAAMDDPVLQQENERAKAFWASMGVNGVPAFVIDKKYLISGAQEVGVLKQVLQQALDEKPGAASAN